MEAEIPASENLHIIPPTSMQLLKKVDLSDECRCVTNYQGKVFVGLSNGGIVTMNVFNEEEPVVWKQTIDGIEGLTFHNSQLYALEPADQSSLIKAYNLSGNSFASWEHPNTYSVTNLTVAGDQILVPDTPNQRLTVYSLSGQVIKHIDCPQLSSCDTCICTVNKDSVIASSCQTSEVFRLNLVTGQVLWTYKTEHRAVGVTCYGDKFVLVADHQPDRLTIRILDADSGDAVGGISDASAMDETDIYDISICGNTLIVPRYDEKAVRFYELK